MRRKRFGIAAVLLLCLQVRAQSGERIGGRVVSARDDHPLVHALVTLWDLKAQRTVESVTTDSEGRFRFDPVPPGKYRMTGAMANYSTSAYRQHEQYSTAIVTGAGLATGSLELRLTPVASIAGRVFDGVEGVPHASVMLYRAEPGSKGKATRERSVQTDDEGEFEIDRLRAGTYFLSVSGTPWYAVHPTLEPQNAELPYRESVDASLDVAYPMVFYPDALDSADALPIEIRGGEQMTANMQMHPEHAVTLSMRMAPGENQNRPFQQLMRTVFGAEEPVDARMSQVDGVRQFSGLAPGVYEVRELSMTGLSTHSRTVDVTGGSTAMDDDAPAETASISVKAHLADGGALPNPLMVSLRGSGTDRGAGARIDDKGVAEISGVPAGSYRLAFSGGGRELHVMAVSADGKPGDNNRISVAGHEHVNLEATLTSALVTVEGVVQRDAKAAPGVFVVLVPAGGDAGEELFRRDQSDLDGSFTFSNVAPGAYIVFACDDAGALHWTDAATLAPYLLHGVPVSVPASDGEVLHVSGAVKAQGR